MFSRKLLYCLILAFITVTAWNWSSAQLQEAPAQAVPQTQTQPLKKDVPYVPTPYPVVEEMLKLANVQSSDVVYDLGCGDGRIVITAAQQYGARGVGIDIDPERIKEANENALKAGVADKVKFLQRDLFESDFSDATVVTLYLLRSVNLRLRPKLLAELKPGTRIVSNTFDMGDWKADRTADVLGRTLYFWVIPEGGKIPQTNPNQ
jgi:SAM-dependent methyltransferase